MSIDSYIEARSTSDAKQQHELFRNGNIVIHLELLQNPNLTPELFPKLFLYCKNLFPNDLFAQLMIFNKPKYYQNPKTQELFDLTTLLK